MRQQKIRFVKTIIIFLIIAIALFSMINYLYISRVLPTTTLYITEKQWQENKHNTTILFMGDSHVKYDINPLYINNSFNFASEGENYIQTYYKLRSILSDQEVTLKTVILPIDLHSFSSFRSSRFRDEWYWNKYVNYWEVSRFDSSISYPTSIIKSYFPAIGSSGRVFRIFINLPRSKIVLGHRYRENDSVFADMNKTKKAYERAKYHFNSSVVLEDQSLEHFRKTIQLAVENNISIYLIKLPMSQEYIDETKKYIPDIEEFYRVVYSYIPEQAEPILLDYQQTLAEDDGLFQDSDHMNKIGGKVLAQLISKDLKANKPSAYRDLNKQILNYRTNPRNTFRVPGNSVW